MSYYGRSRYRSWRSRGYGSSFRPSKYSMLTSLFGGGVGEIRRAFLNLSEDGIDELFSDYGSIYGDSAEKYARKTFPKWKSGATNLSGQTMERLVELVPPYLSAEERFSILQLVLKTHKKSAPQKAIRINVKEPSAGFQELQEALRGMSHDDVLAHLPEKVMEAAKWLYDDDITSARAMLAEAERRENDLIRSSAEKEISLLQRTISSGQVQAANYSVTMPAGTLSVVAYSPSKCYVATVCFGENSKETIILRKWRDSHLINTEFGRKFIVFYYKNGEAFAKIAEQNFIAKASSKLIIKLISSIVNLTQ